MRGWSALLACVFVAQGPVRPTQLDVPGLGLKLPIGWRLVLERGCRYSVPVNWRVTTDGASATGADGSTILVVARIGTDSSGSRTEFKRSLARTHVVHEDDAARLWVEFADQSWREHRVIAGGARVTCVATLEIRQTAGAEEVARTIVQSVAPAPDTWPPSR
jgi:hypothetical protein